MVLTEHKQFYSEIFKIDGFLNSPFLMFGFQELSKGFDSRLKDAKSFKGLLHLMGVQEITVLDYEDKRADVHFDMNYPWHPVTEKLVKGLFKVVADVGCLEHVFNSAQAMKNCMDVVEVGGLYFLHTPVAGYCKHGFHTFNCDMLKWVLKNNGFEIEYEKYSYKNGIEINKLLFGDKANVIIWLVARRVKIMDKFHIPIQDRQEIYESYKTLKTSSRGNILIDQSEKDDRISKSILIGDWDMQDAEIISNIAASPITTGGYIGEGHDPIDLSNQNLNL